jgi:phosphoenolpyruvate-protein kinase (PTS system EI component)
MKKAAVPLLLGMGLDEFSMSPSSIPAVKELIRMLDTSKCKQIAAEALTQPGIQAVKDLLQRYRPI